MDTKRKQQAIEVDREVRKLVRQIDSTWLTVGRLCARCKSEELYKDLGYRNFDTWIYDAVGCSRSRAYVAMRAASNLVPIRDDQFSKITMQNAAVLSLVPKSRQPDLVEAPQTQTEREFRETVDAAVPGLHLESNAHVEFWVPCSLAKVIERCLKKAKVLTQSDSRTDAIELVFSEFELRHPDPEKELEAECQAVS